MPSSSKLAIPNSWLKLAGRFRETCDFCPMIMFVKPLKSRPPDLTCFANVPISNGATMLIRDFDES